MEKRRNPYQGVLNIIRFNWHFYLLASVAIIGLVIISLFLNAPFHLIVLFAALAIGASIVISLFTSYYIYDFSKLYELSWLDKFIYPQHKIVNINAGFDEISSILKRKYSNADLSILDFYDPSKHTEISLERARNSTSSQFQFSQSIQTDNLELDDQFADVVVLFLAAHEIRTDSERIEFFKELKRITKPHGIIAVTEHLRDFPNFLAYNIGFFHFFSKNTWYKTFSCANLLVSQEIKITPFISTFILKKNANPS